jgi:hypothetical protein
MKSLFIAAALLAAVLPAQAQTNVSINIGQPGFYGRIDIGDYAPAPVVYVERPVVIERRVRYEAQPVYLRVPPGHRKNWARHCGRYNACGQRVLFVRDEWYTNSYAPRYREHYRDREHHRSERRDYRDDRDRDRGHGGKHGRGHDKHGDKHHDKHHGKGHGKHRD